VRVVVTGGAGFIGANLARELCASGDEVVVVDDLSTGSESNLAGLDVDLRVGSILDDRLLETSVAEADAVIHLAALASVPRSVADPLATHRVNATGTLRVLDAARRSGGVHVTVASSSAVYGANPQLPQHEGMRCAPLSPYGVSKLATEAYAAAFTECYALPTLALRFFNVFGRLQPAGHAYAAVVPAFIDAALAGRPLPLEGDGSQTRDFVYVGTVARVLADAARRRVTSPVPVNVARGEETSLRELIAMIGDVLGEPVTVEPRPPRAGDIAHSQADATALRSLFPDLAAVPLREGVAETIAWFRDRPPDGG
jgi:UDP-glucose 4-epimerase